MSRIDPIDGYGSRATPSEAIYSSFLEQIELHYEVCQASLNNSYASKAQMELARIRDDISFFISSGIKGLGPLLNHKAFRHLP